MLQGLWNQNVAHIARSRFCSKISRTKCCRIFIELNFFVKCCKYCAHLATQATAFDFCHRTALRMSSCQCKQEMQVQPQLYTPGSVLQDAYGRGFDPDIFRDTQKIDTEQNLTQKNNFIKITNQKDKFILQFLSSVFSAKFKSRMMSYRVVYFYLHSLTSLFVKFEYVAAMKILQVTEIWLWTFKILTKIYWHLCYTLCLSIKGMYCQYIFILSKKLWWGISNTTSKSAASTNIDQSNFAIYRKRLFFFWTYSVGC